MIEKKRPIRRPLNPKPGEWKADEWSRGKIADYKPFNFVDGEGVRCSLYVSGCLFACPGCYNKAIQNFNYGVEYTLELEEQILNDLGESYCQGLTLLGGEPMLNTPILLPLVKKMRQRYGNTKDIWVWSGYTYEELLQETADKQELLALCDVLVDGRYDQTQRDLTLRFRGSRNQRIIDIQQSLQNQQVVLWTDKI